MKNENDQTLKMAYAIVLKNFVRSNWIHINEKNRSFFKKNILNILLAAPRGVGIQLTDVISVIAKLDFPSKWHQLITEMVHQLNFGTLQSKNSVLRIASWIFNRYRYEEPSNSLWEEVKFVVNGFSQPLSELVVNLISAERPQNDELVLYECLIHIADILFSLNVQDLPEIFEEDMESWMIVFHEILVADIPYTNVNVLPNFEFKNGKFLPLNFKIYFG